MHIQDALKLLSIQEETLKFTVEIEANNFHPFLDLKIYNRNSRIDFEFSEKPHKLTIILNNKFQPYSSQAYNNRDHKERESTKVWITQK